MRYVLGILALIGAAIFGNPVFAQTTEWANPEPVVIYGYNGPAQDPFIAPTLPIMLFDSHSSDPTIPSNIFQAFEWDYKTFISLGAVQGLDGGIKANPNVDAHGNFYWWTEAYYYQSLNTSYQGKFANGVVTGTASVLGISRQQNLWVAMSPDSSGDGTILLYGDFHTDSTGVNAKPISSALAVAMRNADGSFTKHPFSDQLLASINNTLPIVYNGRMSTDGLELYFTGVSNLAAGPQIYVAKRLAVTVPFDAPTPIDAAGPMTENGALSRDGKHLYYHRLLGPADANSQIYVLTRP
jgi:hypothetical protein